MEIARRYLIPRQAAENGIKPEDLLIDNQALSLIISHYTLEAGLRNLEREIAKICRKLAMRRAEGGIRAVAGPGRLGRTSGGGGDQAFSSLSSGASTLG